MEAAGAAPGYVLIVEGAIPTGAQGRYCEIWENMTMHQAVLDFAPNAAYIIALGSCASYGGISGGAPNPTNALGVSGVIGNDPRLINVPGCPAHPDWLVGVVTYLLTNGAVPPLDQHKRPLMYFSRRIHDDCLNKRTYCGEPIFAGEVRRRRLHGVFGLQGQAHLFGLPDAEMEQQGAGLGGQNWCIGAKSPCLGCVNPNFPDGMAPFYQYLPEPVRDDGQEGK